MDNLNIKGSLVQKWMKKATAASRSRKASKMMRGEDPGSPLTPGASTYPHSKTMAEDMFDGRRQYIIGFIQEANQKQMAKLRRDVTGLFRNANNKARILYPGYSKMIYDFMGNNNTRSNRSHTRSKEWILSLLTIYNRNNVKSSNSLLAIIYTALPTKY